MKELRSVTRQHSTLSPLFEGTALGKALSRVPKQYLDLSEEEARTLAKPTKTDYALRVSLWREITLSNETGDTISSSRIHRGVCSYQHFWQNVLGRPEKLAWLLQPVRDYEEMLEPLLLKAQERLYEIVTLDFKDKRGRPIPSLVRVLLDTTKMLENRLRGGSVQRLESKNLNVQVEPKSPQPSQEENDKSLDDLLAKIIRNPESYGYGPMSETARAIQEKLKNLESSEGGCD